MSRDQGGVVARLRRALKRALISSPNRDRWQRPEQIIGALELKPGEVVADLGAGGGYFTVRLAHAVGPTGIVYAVDTDADMLFSVDEVARYAGLANVRPTHAEPDGPDLPEPVDLFFLCNAYHHIPDQRHYFERLSQQLAPAGRVAIVESLADGWMARLFGHATAPERIRRDMEAAGYRLHADYPLLDGQSYQVFRRAVAG
ncbi:MAG TPA: methyltransferase domain-containing protein [Candidatus Limnocylindrales bacterium]|nr:methyltransferase domain-containing protein [Candidatus Limnocylindrales bacterium]